MEMLEKLRPAVVLFVQRVNFHSSLASFRGGSSSQYCDPKFLARRQVKMLEKLASGKRRPCFQETRGKVPADISDISSVLNPKKNMPPRRTFVLNSLFMEHITDVMASGEVAPDLAELGIEITRVNVNQHYNDLKVYWLTSRTDDNSDEIGQLLNSYAGKIRSMLSSLHLMGTVPYITFVKDDYQKKVNDVHAALARADFGPNFTPTDQSHHVRSTIILKKEIPDIPELMFRSPDASVKPETSEAECDVDGNPDDVIRSDIYGLDQAALMRYVKDNMRRGHRGQHVVEPEQVPQVGLTSDASGKTALAKNRIGQIKEFIRKRRIDEKRKQHFKFENNAVDHRTAEVFDDSPEDDGWEECYDDDYAEFDREVPVK